jgi:hypothetical protein
MNENNLCCGQIPTKKTDLTISNMPENPKVENGVEIIYLGAGDIKVEGPNSGLTYYASNYRRRLEVETADVSSILKDADFIIKP